MTTTKRPLKNVYLVAKVDISTIHEREDLDVIANIDYGVFDFIQRIAALNIPAAFQLHLNDKGADPIPVAAAGEVVKNWDIKRVYLSNSATSAVLLQLLLEGTKI